MGNEGKWAHRGHTVKISDWRVRVGVETGLLTTWVGRPTVSAGGVIADDPGSGLCKHGNEGLAPGGITRNNELRL